jgi:hypothetical protein
MAIEGNSVWLERDLKQFTTSKQAGKETCTFQARAKQQKKKEKKTTDCTPAD